MSRAFTERSRCSGMRRSSGDLEKLLASRPMITTALNSASQQRNASRSLRNHAMDNIVSGGSLVVVSSWGWKSSERRSVTCFWNCSTSSISCSYATWFRRMLIRLRKDPWLSVGGIVDGK
ncbi:hypothetical protein HanRHA438_Chr17g0790001 [Helianthus annuus]|nr:hypothetical protein HanRHA438_Chr17g0790001 [Helianthus annuus]